MSILGAALISFFAAALILSHWKCEGVNRLVGYAKYVDIVLHCTIIYMFIHTSTLGLMQAELTACMFSLSLRAWRYFKGYARLERRGWRSVWKTYPPTRFNAPTGA